MANKSRDNYYKTHESNLHDYNSDYRLCISLRTKEGDSGEEEIIQRLEELGYKQSEGENIDDAKIGEYMLAWAGVESELSLSSDSSRSQLQLVSTQQMVGIQQG